MLVHVMVAYVVFCAVPLGLGLSLAWRRRRVERALRARMEEDLDCTDGGA